MIGLIINPNWTRKVCRMIIDMGQNNRGYVRLVFYIPEKGWWRKTRKIFEEIYFFSAKEKKYGEGIGERYHGGGKHLAIAMHWIRWKTEKKEENIFCGEGNQRKKRGQYLKKEKVFFGGEEKRWRIRRKIFFCGGEENEKAENIWRRKIFCSGGEEKRRK